MVRSLRPACDRCTHVVADLPYIILPTPTCGAADGCGVVPDVVDDFGCDW